MPWCEECSKFWTPSSLSGDGSCPSCGRTIATATPEVKAPWHFKLMVLAVIAYLLYRHIQILGWLF